MGAEVFPVFKTRVPAAEFNGDGKQLLHKFRELDSIADQLGLARFSSFGDNRYVPEGFDGDPDELEELLGARDEWFVIDEGLTSMEGVLHAIRTRPEVAEQVESPESICEDLEDLIRCLEIARKVGAKFRLEVG